jgi:hypothetical protein
MRVLLLGEFSGVNTDINKYLLSKKYEVSFLAEQDGWKDYRGLSFFYKYGPSKWLYFINLIYVVFNLKKLTNYDYVFFLTPNFPGKLYYIFGIYHFLFRFNRTVVYYACGTDYGYVEMQKCSEYSPFVEGGAKIPKFSALDIMLFHWFTRKVSMIYSSSPDYSYYFSNYLNYRGHKNLPLFFDKINCGELKLESKSNDVVKIFHPISRPEFKGSRFILEALNSFKDFSGVEIIIAEKLSLLELEEHLRAADILIDQCLGYGFGVLATLGMKHGCVVLTGFRETNFCSFHPGIYNIDPDVMQIVNLLDSLINLPKHELRNRQFSSYKYITELNRNNIKDIFE